MFRQRYLKKAVRAFIILAVILFIPACFLYAQQREEETITTYYPSPSGSYDRLQARGLAVGDSANAPNTDKPGIVAFSLLTNNPSGSVAGQIYYNASKRRFRYNNGCGWKDFGTSKVVGTYMKWGMECFTRLCCDEGDYIIGLTTMKSHYPGMALTPLDHKMRCGTVQAGNHCGKTQPAAIICLDVEFSSCSRNRTKDDWTGDLDKWMADIAKAREAINSAKQDLKTAKIDKETAERELQAAQTDAEKQAARQKIAAAQQKINAAKAAIADSRDQLGELKEEGDE